VREKAALPAITLGGLRLVMLGVGAVLFTVKVAVTVTGVLPVRTQGAVPPQPPPLQPLKDEPVVGVAVRVRTVPVA
jgi:hypothetical protein